MEALKRSEWPDLRLRASEKPWEGLGGGLVSGGVFWGSSRLSGPLVPKFACRGGPGPSQTPRIHPEKKTVAGLSVGQASGLDRPAPSMSGGISAAHHRRWAAYTMSL